MSDKVLDEIPERISKLDFSTSIQGPRCYSKGKPFNWLREIFFQTEPKLRTFVCGKTKTCRNKFQFVETRLDSRLGKIWLV